MNRGYSTSNEIQHASSRSGADSLLVSSHSKRTSRSKWNPFMNYLRFRRKRLLTVEPVLFLYMFGLYLNLFVTGQYVFNRYGREKYNVYSNFTGAFNFCITTKELDALDNGTVLANEVEEESSGFGLVSGVATQLPSILAALVYGPLSNRAGLRWILLVIASLACVGGIVSILIVHFNWSIYYLIGVGLFNALGGNLTGMLTATFTYIADIASNKWLTLRLGILEAMIFVAGMVSFASSGIWLRTSGCDFVQPLLLYVACNVGIILYTLLYLPDSLTSRERREKMAKTPHEGFKLLIRGVKIFFINHYSRWRLWFAVIAVVCLYLNAFGLASFLNLFLLDKPLQWNLGEIGVYLALAQAFHGIALLFVLPILTACRLPDSLIILTGVLISFSGFILTGFVETTWEMFALSVYQGMEAISGPPLRSVMSKAVSVEDQGPLFSIIAAVQVLASVLASVIFSFFYPFSIRIGWPSSSAFFLLAAISIIPLPLIIVLLIFRNGPGAVHRPEPRPDPEEAEESEHDLPTTETKCLLDEMASSASKESSFRLSTSGENYGTVN